jgi:hypothetical protein
MGGEPGEVFAVTHAGDCDGWNVLQRNGTFLIPIVTFLLLI